MFDLIAAGLEMREDPLPVEEIPQRATVLRRQRQNRYEGVVIAESHPLFIMAQDRSSHMQSQDGFPYQAAAPTLEYVGVGRRLLALIIDGIILLIASWIIGLVFHSGGGMTAGGDAWDKFKHIGPGAALQIICPFVYFIVMEAMQGATIGKMALGIRVVKLDGSPMSWGASIIRNLLRIVDHMPYTIPYLLGALLIGTSPTRQRLGDRVAHTVVVRRR